MACFTGVSRRRPVRRAGGLRHRAGAAIREPQTLLRDPEFFPELVAALERLIAGLIERQERSVPRRRGGRCAEQHMPHAPRHVPECTDGSAITCHDGPRTHVKNRSGDADDPNHADTDDVSRRSHLSAVSHSRPDGDARIARGRRALVVHDVRADLEREAPRSDGGLRAVRRHALAEPADRCPRCSMPRGTLTLLTSTTRYYVCGRCRRRWHCVRDGVDGYG